MACMACSTAHENRVTQRRRCCLVDEDQPREPVIFVRGSSSNRGPQVPRRFLACLSAGAPPPFQKGSGRLEMAQAIASPENPLTARVWVNRVWAHLFGSGLVTTTSDFGTRSDPPSHPELLDWLACRFMEQGWSTKWLIREIVLSRVYQQASTDRPDCAERDPENRLLWRANRRRLDLESMRDSLLVAAGRLDKAMGGASVQLTERPFATRRSVYGFIERQNLPNFFRTFDFAGPDTHAPSRPYTTVPQQALFLMNSPFVLEQAGFLASRGVSDEASDDQRITALFRSAIGREPSSEEREMCQAYVTSDAADAASAAEDAVGWQYGWGKYDAQSGSVTFQPLPHFTGQTWQGGQDLPDPVLGWVSLTAAGGHPGNDLEHAAIRRWIAAKPGTIRIRGKLEHRSDQGDGVCGRVVTQHQGMLAEWSVHNGETRTPVEPFPIEAGQGIDFLVDCRSGPSHDGFRWTATVRLEAADGSFQEWSSEDVFRGPPSAPLTRWERLAHVLLMSNEFLFVD